MEQQALIWTNDHCVGCNKCVRVCASPGASRLRTADGISVVSVDPARCVSCGACFALCEHGAREYRDDTAAFFQDLEDGLPVSVLLAPSFRASYPEEYGALLGRLKALGVRRIIDVAFGADLYTWACLNLMEKENLRGALSTACPVVVEYVEKYRPELIPLLMPVRSPMLCAAAWCREQLGITDRLAFIGPCIGKKLETEASMPGSPVRYNVTYQKLTEYLRAHPGEPEDASGEIGYGLGSFYPAPGGLAYNIRWFLGEDTPVRVISGKTKLYSWLGRNAGDLLDRRAPFELIEVLNCRNGCIEGTAGEEGRFENDLAMYHLGRIRAERKRSAADSPWNPDLPPEKRLGLLNRQFAGLSLSSFRRGFTDRSGECRLRCPSPEEETRIFREMHKRSEKSRNINCSACGYGTCRDLMIAIYNGFNNKQSCIHYEKEESLRIERLASCDRLTLVMNRNAWERQKLLLKPCGRSVAVLLADINGLKDVNDRLGHEAGDTLIVTVASCLGDVFGRENVYRIGGDEFVVLQLDHTEEECLAGIAEVRGIMEKLRVSASIGCAYRPVFDLSLDDLQKQADSDMYANKQEHYRNLGKKSRSSPAGIDRAD